MFADKTASWTLEIARCLSREWEQMRDLEEGDVWNSPESRVALALNIIRKLVQDMGGIPSYSAAELLEKAKDISANSVIEYGCNKKEIIEQRDIVYDFLSQQGTFAMPSMYNKANVNALTTLLSLG